MANEFIARKGLIALDNSGISGSLNVSGSLTIESSGSTLFEIIGSEGQLFSVTDNLSGSLFAVSDVSGLPILEVFSDDTVKIGTFNNEAIIVNGSTAIVSGSFSGSFEGDGSGLTGISAAAGTLSSSAQIATEISGAFTSTSASIATNISTNTSNISTNTSNIATLTAATSSYSTATGVENNADVTDTANVTAAGALMDSEVTSLSLIKGLTAAQISGAFDATSASLAADIPTNNNQLTNGAGYTTNTGTVDTSGTPANNQIAIFTDADTIEGDSDLTWDGSILGVIGTVGVGTDNPTYQLHVSSSTAALGVYERAGGAALYLEGQETRGVLGTVGTHPLLIAYNSGEVARFTGTSFLVTGSLDITDQLSIPGFPDVSASLAAAVAGGDNLGNHTATIDLNMGGNDIVSVGNVDGVDVSTLKSDFDTLEGKTLVSSSAQTVANLDGQNVTVNSLTVENSSTGFQLKDSSGTSTYVKFSPQGGLEIDPGGTGNSISASSDITTHGDIIGESTHIKLIGPDGGGGSFTYLSSSGDPAAGGFKLSLGDIDGVGNTTTITINDNTEQILLSKALSVTGNITVTGTVDGVDIASLETSVQANDAKIVSLTAATSSYSTATGVEDNADVTDTANVTAAGALMDSEVTNLAQVKAFDSSDYATAAQGALADTAIQPADTGSFLTTVAFADVTGKPTLISSSAQVDHDATANFSADEHFTQANITTVGTVTSGDVSAILPTGTVSGSSQISDLGFVNNSQSARITFLYTSSIAYAPPGYIVFLDQATDNIIINTSSYNGVDLDASVGNDYAKFQFNEAGSLITVRKLSDGSFKTYKIITATTNYTGNADNVGYLVDGASFINVMESGSISDGDEVEFIWDKSAGVGGAYGPTEGTATKTFAGLYQPGYNYLDIFFGKISDDEFDGDPANLSGVEPSASFTDSRYFLPAISQSESLTLGGLTVNGTITGTINTSSITDFPTEVSRSAAAAGFGSGGGGGKSTSHTGYLELQTNSQTVLIAGPANGIYAADYTSGNNTTIGYNHGGTIPSPGVTTYNSYPYYIRGSMIDLHHDVSELSFTARMRDQGQQAASDEIFVSIWYNSSGAASTFTQQTYTCIATGSTTFPGSSLNIVEVKISATATGLSLVEGGTIWYGFGWVDAPPANPDVITNWSLGLYE